MQELSTWNENVIFLPLYSWLYLLGILGTYVSIQFFTINPFILVSVLFFGLWPSNLYLHLYRYGIFTLFFSFFIFLITKVDIFVIIWKEHGSAKEQHKHWILAISNISIPTKRHTVSNYGPSLFKDYLRKLLTKRGSLEDSEI